MTSQCIRKWKSLSLAVALAMPAAPTVALAAPVPPIHVTGVVRDFREKTEEGGHPDFENMPPTGLGRYAGGIALSLGDDGKPVHTGPFKKITQQWRDASNRQIAWSMNSQFPAPGDILGEWGQASTAGITSTASFHDWFHDVPVFNMSAPLTLTLNWNPAISLYVFDDTQDPFYLQRGGFFPIDDMLFGNSPPQGGGPGGGGGGGGNPNLNHNFHFTFELHTLFQYSASGGQPFKFTGNNNDVWTFVDGALVNDLTGIHAAHDQFVDLNRMGLIDGEWYTLDFFFAQRFRPDSHFRIETNVQLESLVLDTVSAVFD